GFRDGGRRLHGGRRRRLELVPAVRTLHHLPEVILRDLQLPLATRTGNDFGHHNTQQKGTGTAAFLRIYPKSPRNTNSFIAKIAFVDILDSTSLPIHLVPRLCLGTHYPPGSAWPGLQVVKHILSGT